VVIDNRSGSSTSIAADIAAKAAPNGYTLFMQDITTHGINASLYPKLPFDPVNDFSAVILVGYSPLVLVAHTAFPAGSVAELIEVARASPGKLNFASGGNGSSSHLAGELLKLMTKIEMTHVAYKGGALAMTDVISGQMPLLVFSLPGALPQIRAGRVKAIGVTSARRATAAPEIPTIAESGVAGYDASAGYGLLGPAALPRQIIAKLNSEILQILRNPEVAASIVRQGAEPVGGTPAEFLVYLKAEIGKWEKVVRAARLRPD
jgi:tripartite-type tricarboxylate transporter receptor subunit TctC